MRKGHFLGGECRMVPAYIRIHDAIKKQIDDGFWEIGQRLPSERDLADEYEVSRMTLRQAITLLVEEGILERRVGSGTYVASHRVQEKKNRRPSCKGSVMGRKAE